MPQGHAYPYCQDYTTENQGADLGLSQGVLLATLLEPSQSDIPEDFQQQRERVPDAADQAGQESPAAYKEIGDSGDSQRNQKLEPWG